MRLFFFFLNKYTLLTLPHLTCEIMVQWFCELLQVWEGIWWPSKPAECPLISTAGVLLERFHPKWMETVPDPVLPSAQQVRKRCYSALPCTEKLPYSATRENPQLVDTLSSVTVTKIISKKKKSINARMVDTQNASSCVWINTFGRTGSTMMKKQTKNNRNSSDILSPAIPPIRRIEETNFKFTKEQTLKTQNPLSEGGKV